MSAKLTLASGSHAGVEGPLKHGYYMIGRDQECQIRPRSHSVSRRHCLLHHSDHGLRVFDLASANGTYVNDQRLKPNQWVWLNSGDRLKCGKLMFDVFVERSSEHVGPVSLKVENESDPPVIEDGAWEEFDIVDFLEAEDEAERQERYASLQTQRGKEKSDSDSDDDATVRDESHARSREVTSIDLVRGDKEAQAVLEEARSKAAAKADEKSDDPDSRLSARALRIAALRSKIETERVKAERSDAIKQTLGQGGRVIKRPLPGSSGRSSSRKAGAPPKPATDGQAGRLKLYAVVLFAALAGSYFIYFAYQVANGTPTQVIEDID